MKIIIIRSLRVVLVLAILCASVNLVFSKSLWFIPLMFVSFFFLDAADSMLVWRLKRITDSRFRSSLICAYLTTTVITACPWLYLLVFRINPIYEGRYVLTLVILSGLVAIFSFRYFVIVVRVMARFMDKDYDDC